MLLLELRRGTMTGDRRKRGRGGVLYIERLRDLYSSTNINRIYQMV
jgi:hypothetical protein